MRNLVKYFCLILLSLQFESCYTIILKPQPSVHVLTPYERQTIDFNNLEFNLNQRLIDAWSNYQLWMDYGEEIKRLEFYTNGKIRYSSR